MNRRSDKLTHWAAGGAIAAIVVSVLTILLPPELGGYNAWNDAHLALHNLAAILVRMIIFAMVGAALASAWCRNRRLNR
jgi:Na+/H+ antiporter NhaC